MRECHRRRAGTKVFQSTPTNTGGRCACMACRMLSSGAFQSTPTNTGGRCAMASRTAPESCRFQSTPTNTGGRCGFGSTRSETGPMFQSTPTNTGGRCSFQPPAALNAAAFQSTPTNTGGRCPRAARPAAACPCFNPRPPILAGDAAGACDAGQDAAVSIHAHQYWRAMPTSYSDATPDGKFQSTPTNTGGRCLGWAGHAVGSLMFQSTPTNTGGRCTAPPPEPPRIPVSIHAHQYWRAMRANGPCAWEGRHVSIHAHQYWRAMPMRLRFLGLFLLFQSTPTNTGGRCRAVPQRRIRPRCFNPRPPILAGDAYGLIAHDIQRLVLIHAHQYWRAMLAVKRRRYALQQFQSTPTNTGGRCGHEAFPVMLLTMFQSTPTNTGGRCHQLQGKVSLHHVSIHAHQYWRAMRLAHDVAVFHRVVSIHAHQYWRAMPVGNAPVQRGARVSIHAHQYWRAMRRPFLDACATVWFQSTPTNTGGRCRRGRCPR